MRQKNTFVEMTVVQISECCLDDDFGLWWKGLAFSTCDCVLMKNHQTNQKKNKVGSDLAETQTHKKKEQKQRELIEEEEQ